MMAGKPRTWSMSNMISSSSQDNNHHHHQSSTSSGYLPTCPSLLPQYHQAHRSTLLSSSPLSLNSSNFVGDDDDDDGDDQDQFPHSWSQLLASGLGNEEGIILNQYSIREVLSIGDIKHENSQRSHLYGGNNGDANINDHELKNDHQNTSRGASNWSHQQVNIQSSSPKSSITSLGSNLLDFSSNKRDLWSQIPDQLSECNSTSTGGVSKKARLHSSSTQPPFKVRKEKLGDRITALHQLVSPFGKTDTASVLLEVIGYIRFLQGQIEALSSPYLRNASTNMRHHHSGKLDGLKKDLKSRGLCLVPVSCTRHLSNDNGAYYWGRSPGGGL